MIPWEAGMTAIVTDAHYRMSVALIRDLAQNGVRVIACELDTFSEPVGFAARGVSQRALLAAGAYEAELYALCEHTMRQDGEKPALLPVGAATLALLAKRRERFDAVCGLCIPSSAQLALFNDKQALSEYAKTLGVPVPESFKKAQDEEDADFFSRVPLPCVIKPLCGEKFGLHAAQRYRIAKTQAELSGAYRHFEALTHEAPVVQQYLAGGALGCSALCKDGQIVCAIAHRRLREYPVTGGPSSCCEVIDAAPLLPFVQKLVEKTRYTGVAMFEFKQDAAGAPYLLEVNPRVWGTYPLTRVSKSNFTMLWLALCLERTPSAYMTPQAVTMVYYPSDYAAALGYLRRGDWTRFFAALRDWFDPKVKNGLSERSDPAPSRRYWKQLLTKGRHA